MLADFCVRCFPFFPSLSCRPLIHLSAHPFPRINVRQAVSQFRTSSVIRGVREFPYFRTLPMSLTLSLWKRCLARRPLHTDCSRTIRSRRRRSRSSSRWDSAPERRKSCKSVGEREIEGVVNRARAAVGRTGIKNFPHSMDRQLPNLLLRPIFRSRLGGLQKNNLPWAFYNLGEFQVIIYNY